MRILREFIQHEAAGGILLFIAAIVAIFCINSPLQKYYILILQPLEQSLPISLKSYYFLTPLIQHTWLFYINDVLMPIFFLLVGLEIKRELIIGELSHHKKAILPVVSALGGILVPAIIYLMFNVNYPELKQGWAIPTATDIAFALGVVKLLGKRVPISLQIFLTALAIIDDLGAIVIIALFYTKQLQWNYLFYSIVCLIGFFTLNYKKVIDIIWYLLVGVFLWYFLLKAGIHPTIAGVLLAFAIPVKHEKNLIAQKLEHVLSPWVSFFILPLFAFANSGLVLTNININSLFSSMVIGISLGLVIGKPIGVTGFAWLAVKLQWAKLPNRINWWQMFGISLLCGVGFTMSLFIGGLAFNNDSMNLVRLGVVLGSLIAGGAGYLFHYFNKPTSVLDKF